MTRFHLDTLDLYQARARSLFAQSAAKLCGVGEQQVSADLLRLIEKLEAVRLAMRKNGDEQNQHEAPMTPAERDTALQYLKEGKNHLTPDTGELNRKIPVIPIGRSQIKTTS